MDIQKYTITNVIRKDEWNSGYGAMQDYGIALEGFDGWVKLTQKVTTKPPVEGDVIEGYIEDKSDKNDNPFKKFTKQKAEYANQPSNSGQNSASGSQEAYIVKMLEELTGRRKVEDTVAYVPDEPLKDPFEGMNI